ncbi:MULTISPECIES: hypothetical protein [Gordonia]|uniref:Transmembrane protein n=1 Tax=Gordonia sihwensis NBRC 108236 TaxID=1223544 RepID=L7LPL7_9ACTN|nr:MULTISPECIES: hypothetical protein [Gordonia]AUH67718.1 hypothetical protein CXX93_04385 [Gordonia sp. YC-JH1]GAC61978.1 hypothetical protein GSI01S_27_00270 [Gordonia sihwensis NBRC 108236]
MNNWAIVAAAAVLAATIATIAFVRYRQNETAVLKRDAELAASLRELAGTDAVRLAAVEEFETAVYERLFFSRAIGPRIRSAVWALLGGVLAASAVLLLDGIDSAVGVVAWAAAIVFAIGFTLAAVVYAAVAGYSALTTPRVSFADSYESDKE